MSISECNNILTLYCKQQQLKSNSSNSSITNLGCSYCYDNKELSKFKKTGIATCSVLGVATSLALMAKLGAGKSLNPKNIISNGWKNSYLANAVFKSGSIISMVTGSIIGGLTGGAVFDKNEKFSSKTKEAIMQFSNASIPILFVDVGTNFVNNLSKKVMSNWSNSANFFKKAVTKAPVAVAALGSLMFGMICANKVSNKFNEKIFKDNDGRKIKATDFSVHVDDIGVAATFVLDSKNPVTKFIQKAIPVALCIPGYEVGIARNKSIQSDKL